MRSAFHNPFVVVSALLSAVSALIFLAWVFLTPPALPALETQVNDARTLLERARANGRVGKLAYPISIPPSDKLPTDQRKALFMAKFLPLIVAENTRIAKQRDQLQKHDLAPAQLNALGLAYGLRPSNVSRAELLSRIDVLPVSLVLAQGAIESAWGTSRFAQEGNAYFGERTFDPDAPGITPKRATGFKVKSFDSAKLSVRSYMRTINTHRAYKALRLRRAQLRENNQMPSGAELAHYLKDYSEIGSDYISLIDRTISSNRLGIFDQISLLQD